MAKTSIIAFASLFILSQSQDIFCPDSNGDDEAYSGSNDFGLNIYAQSSGSYDEDCYVRYSRLHSPSAATMLTDFIIPSSNLLVVSHGWMSSSPRNPNDHTTPDQWSKIVVGSCTSSANPGGSLAIEPCEPVDHACKYWTQNGWNCVFIDWRQFATESEVKDAEAKIYTAAYNGQTVPELIFDKLKAVLDLTSWNGNEIRFAGHSLGAQVVLNLAAKWKLDAPDYADNLKRVALLDHFFSRGGKDYLEQSDPSCNDWWVWKCDHLWTGEYARNELLPTIRGGNVPVVIENYRTSLTSSTWFVGDSNSELNKRTVFVQKKPWYYGSSTLTTSQAADKHIVALADYLHCMKFPLDNSAPNCRMSTDYLKSNYCPSDGTSKCLKTFVQNGDSGAYTTWNTDDTYTASNV